MPSRITEESKELFNSANIISKFLALEQIYSAKELDTYLQTLQQKDADSTQSNTTAVDVIVLCASAILAIPEAVFEWAAQQQACPDARRGNTILVLCGGVGPCTPFVYDAIRASKKYSQISEDAQGKPEGQILRTMAERFYRLDINTSKESSKYDGGFKIIVSDRSTDCGADALEARKTLDDYGVGSPRSINVVQDPAMSSRTVLSFEKVYNDQRARIFDWPPIKSDLTRIRQESQVPDKNRAPREIWSMDRFLDRIMGDTSGGQNGLGKSMKNSLDIPNEVENAWSTIMGKDSLKASC